MMAWDDYHHQRYFDVAYDWLAARVGFWPLFLTVGSDPYAEWATGYSHQFRPGEDARVMFSWADLPEEGVFIDDGWWNALLNHVRGEGCTAWHIDEPDDELIDGLFRPDHTRADWILCAERAPHAVQLVVPALELHSAERICCPSRDVARDLTRRGYPAEVIHTLRMRVDPFHGPDDDFVAHAPAQALRPA